MKFKIGNVEIKNQVVLAPMAGITNTSYRKIIKEKGELFQALLKKRKDAVQKMYCVLILRILLY